MPKHWYAMNKDPYPSIDIVKIYKNQYYLYFPKPQVDFADTIEDDGFTKKNDIVQYQLYPQWKLYYNGDDFAHNNRAIIQYLKDSLRQDKPNLSISSQGKNYAVKLLGIEELESNPYNLSLQYKRYWIRYRVESKEKKLPKKLKDLNIVIKSKTLPEDRYEYGQCGSITGTFKKCSTSKYFFAGGGTFNTHYTTEYCQVFDMAKGSSHYKCSVDEGS